MLKKINIAVDIETFSTSPEAAMFAIAAKYFNPFKDEEVSTPKKHEFFMVINPIDVIFKGYDLDSDTLHWWAEKDDKLKQIFLDVPESRTLKATLLEFNSWIDFLKKEFSTDSMNVWMEGTDFDGAIMRNAYFNTFPDLDFNHGNHKMPWKFWELKDARTLGAVYGEIFKGIENPMEMKDKFSEGHNYQEHNPMVDVDMVIDKVRTVYRKVYNMATFVKK